MLLLEAAYSSKVFSLNPLITMTPVLCLRFLATFETFLHVCRTLAHAFDSCMTEAVHALTRLQKDRVCVCVRKHEHTCKLVCVGIDRFVEGSVQVAVLT